MDICVLELRLTPAAYRKSIPCFYNDIVFCMILVYFYTIHIKRIISEQHE